MQTLGAAGLRTPQSLCNGVITDRLLNSVAVSRIAAAIMSHPNREPDT